MSSSHESQSWLDRWWTLLVILFGLTGILILALWHPAS